MRIGYRMIGKKEMAVIGLGPTDKHADFGTGQRGRADAGILERFPGQLEQDALLRIICSASRGEMPNTLGSKPHKSSRMPAAQL